MRRSLSFPFLLLLLLLGALPCAAAAPVIESFGACRGKSTDANWESYGQALTLTISDADGWANIAFVTINGVKRGRVDNHSVRGGLVVLVRRLYSAMRPLRMALAQST